MEPNHDKLDEHDNRNCFVDMRFNFAVGAVAVLAAVLLVLLW